MCRAMEARSSLRCVSHRYPRTLSPRKGESHVHIARDFILGMEGECQQGACDEIPETEGDHTHFGEAAAQGFDDALADSRGIEDSSSYYADELDKYLSPPAFRSRWPHRVSAKATWTRN